LVRFWASTMGSMESSVTHNGEIVNQLDE